jgi:hypothetical protein
MPVGVEPTLSVCCANAAPPVESVSAQAAAAIQCLRFIPSSLSGAAAARIDRIVRRPVISQT